MPCSRLTEIAVAKASKIVVQALEAIVGFSRQADEAHSLAVKTRAVLGQELEQQLVNERYEELANMRQAMQQAHADGSGRFTVEGRSSDGSGRFTVEGRSSCRVDCTITPLLIAARCAGRAGAEEVRRLLFNLDGAEGPVQSANGVTDLHTLHWHSWALLDDAMHAAETTLYEMEQVYPSPRPHSRRIDKEHVANAASVTELFDTFEEKLVGEWIHWVDDGQETGMEGLVTQRRSSSVSSSLLGSCFLVNVERDSDGTTETTFTITESCHFYVATSVRKHRRDEELARVKQRLAQQHAEDTQKMTQEEKAMREQRNCQKRSLKSKKKVQSIAKKESEQEALRKMEEKKREEEQRRLEAKAKLRKQKKEEEIRYREQQEERDRVQYEAERKLLQADAEARKEVEQAKRQESEMKAQKQRLEQEEKQRLQNEAQLERKKRQRVEKQAKVETQKEERRLQQEIDANVLGRRTAPPQSDRLPGRSGRSSGSSTRDDGTSTRDDRSSTRDAFPELISSTRGQKQLGFPKPKPTSTVRPVGRAGAGVGAGAGGSSMMGGARAQVADTSPAGQLALKHADWKSGDWSCAKCGDHQFASNKLCRLCGAPRPQVLRPAEEDSSSFGLGLVKRIAIDEVTGYMFHCSRYAHHRCIKSCGL
jgi:hypothetical protein